MSDDRSSHPAAQTLVAFFAAMNTWGREMIDLYHSIQFDLEDDADDDDPFTKAEPEQRRKLESIFARFCDVGEGAERLKDMGVSFPASPEYDPALETIVSIEESRNGLFMETRRLDPPHWSYGYELVEAGGVWRIRDSRLSRVSDEQEWLEVGL